MRGLAREEKALCGSNLGAAGQNGRLRQAALFLAASLGLTIFLVESDISRFYRLLLFFPFMMASMGALEGLYRTCPGHMIKRTRVNDAGEVQPVVSADEVIKARRLGSCVLATGLLSALACTTLVFFLP